MINDKWTHPLLHYLAALPLVIEATLMCLNLTFCYYVFAWILPCMDTFEGGCGISVIFHSRWTLKGAGGVYFLFQSQLIESSDQVKNSPVWGQPEVTSVSGAVQGLPEVWSSSHFVSVTFLEQLICNSANLCVLWQLQSCVHELSGTAHALTDWLAGWVRLLLSHPLKADWIWAEVGNSPEGGTNVI